MSSKHSLPPTKMKLHLKIIFLAQHTTAVKCKAERGNYHLRSFQIGSRMPQLTDKYSSKLLLPHTYKGPLTLKKTPNQNQTKPNPKTTNKTKHHHTQKSPQTNPVPPISSVLTEKQWIKSV